ncbi:permease [Natrialba asiatica]|uniref:Putative metal ion permease n=1 Tax=Natrialba asiatica (strain ATCC 700177 / DSM 12278 / JCM 9576 / FERM P-10747 / NBRC 102637 / 172P1) TaxID=29540 RepID=M0ALZ4_NATA1|nr:permease [Natrialba asiatica]ELY99539.1 putative metal ion permease [Natrialba asiatica DSM 12278]
MLSEIHLLTDQASLWPASGHQFVSLLRLLLVQSHLESGSAIINTTPTTNTTTTATTIAIVVSADLGFVFGPISGGGLDLAARLVGLLGAFLLQLVTALVVALEMAWDTWWALVLGFTITGAIQEFVDEDQLTDYLGDDGWREIGYGTAFGTASSSCSFSAVAMTRSLFTKGASAASSLGAFQFASTDLVLELALVVLTLLGWQFAVAEITGGLIAVVVLGIIYRRFVPPSWVERARSHARALDETECATCGMAAPPTDEETITRTFDGEHRYFCCGGCLNAYDPADDREAVTAGPELLSGDRWQSAITNTMSEWDMLWRDILFGFLLAGLLAAFVPDAWWTALFGVGPEGSLTRLLSNVVLGAIVGVLTFLCSVGNIPFAVVLWQNGVSFGGVLAFIFADLLILPLVRTYHRYYGLRMAGVMFAAFFAAAVIAGFLVELVFSGVGLVPSPGTSGGTVPGAYTSLFNVVTLPLFAVQVYVALEPDQRVRLGNRIAPHVAGVLYHAYDLVRRVAYALESRGLK